VCNKNKNKKITGTLKSDGGVFKNLVIVRAEQGVKAWGWDPNEFRGVGVRWGVGWLKTTKGGVSLTAEPVCAYTIA
jgi:hypothetical protein